MATRNRIGVQSQIVRTTGVRKPAVTRSVQKFVKIDATGFTPPICFDDLRIVKPETTEMFLRTVANGLAEFENGRTLRKALRAMMNELDRDVPKPVRDECARLTGQTLTTALGLATGNAVPKSITE